MKLFRRRGYEMTLNRVHDTVTFREGDDKITLTVNGDAMRMVAGLNRAQARMNAITEETPDADVLDVAEYFATVLFGKEQAAQLMAFYADDPGCVIYACGQYFKERLAEKIANVQRRVKRAEVV